MFSDHPELLRLDHLSDSVISTGELKVPMDDCVPGILFVLQNPMLETVSLSLSLSLPESLSESDHPLGSDLSATFSPDTLSGPQHRSHCKASPQRPLTNPLTQLSWGPSLSFSWHSYQPGRESGWGPDTDVPPLPASSSPFLPAGYGSLQDY